MGQGFTLIHRLKFAWMDELVPEPREFGGIESFHQPVDHVAHPGDAATAGMVGQPNIERLALLALVFITSKSRWERPGKKLSKASLAAVWSATCSTSRCLAKSSAVFGT